MKTGLIFALFAVACVGCASAPPLEKPGESQLIEIRDGRRCVWGMTIRVADYRFSQDIKPEQMQVTIARTGKDITDRMVWSVSADRRRLEVALKPGEKDLGMGSSLQLRLSRFALEGYSKTNDPRWSVPTTPTDWTQAGLDWGSGVVDPDQVHARMELLVSYVNPSQGDYLKDEDARFVMGMIKTLTWEQAAYVYRKASHTLKIMMSYDLIDGQQERFEGKTREQIIALLGEPDEQGPCEDEWGGAWAMSYNGYGRVSDSTGALILYFDKDGKFLRYGYPG